MARVAATPEPAVAAPPVPQTGLVTQIAQDQSGAVDGGILGAKCRIPAEHLAPGPRGARFQVIDYDADERRLIPPRDLDLIREDPFAQHTDAQLLRDPHFRQLNVYVVAARTLAAFESALGRRIEWA